MRRSLGSLGLTLLLALSLATLTACSSAQAPAPTAAPAKQAESKPAAAAPTSAPAAAPAAATSAPAAAQPAAAPATGPAIKVAFIGSFSGLVADLGMANVNGAKLSVEAVNKAGGIQGRPIELVTYDDTNDPSVAVTRAQKAITSDGAQVIIGGTNAPTAMSIRGVSNQAKIVDISPQAQNRELTEGMPWIFRVGTIDLYNGRALVALMMKLGYKKPALISDNTAFGQSGDKSLQEALTEKGIKWVTDQKHNAGATDMTAQVLAGKNGGGDVILSWSQGADAALIAKTKKQLGYDVPLMGLDSLMHASALPIAGDAYEGAVAVSIADTSRPDVQAFFDSYQKTYGIPPATIYSPCQGYDAVQLLAAGLRKIAPIGDKVDQEKLKAALETVSFEGMTGPKGTKWTFTPTNHNGLPEGASVFYKVQGGKWVRYMSLADVLK